MEEVQNFLNRWNGRGVDFDKAYGYQCMDLYQQFNKDVVGAFHVPNPSAYMVWDNYPQNFYTKISNSPTAVPQKGDVVIWKKSASLPFGHIAIATGEGDTKKFKSMDQNWPTGSVCHIQEHNYTGVIGWLRPNKLIKQKNPAVSGAPANSAVITQEIAHQPQITDQTRIPQIDNKEVQAIRSELRATHDRVGELDQQIQTARENLLLANSKYTDLKTEYEGYKAQNPPLAGLSLLELIQLYLKKKQG